MKAQDFKVFMRQADIPMDAKGLWCLILTWANQDGSNAFPTQETLAQVSKTSETWVKKRIRILRKKGFLGVTRERKSGSRYFHNVYWCKTRGQSEPLYGGQSRPLTKSLYQNSDSLAVESEAILRVVKYEAGTEETPEKYG